MGTGKLDFKFEKYEEHEDGSRWRWSESEGT